MDISPKTARSIMCCLWRDRHDPELIARIKEVVGRQRGSQNLLVIKMTRTLFVLFYHNASHIPSNVKFISMYLYNDSKTRFNPLISFSSSNLAPFSLLSSAAKGETSIFFQPRHTCSTRSAGVSVPASGGANTNM